MKRILLVEDDAAVAGELERLLLENNYQVELVRDFSDTAAQILRSGADLILLDINIPVLSGSQVLRQVREKSGVPVIILTSKSETIDEAVNISYGADDFIRKPFNSQVLLLRIEALLRRAAGEVTELITYKNVTLLPAKSAVRHGAREVSLSKNEQAILSFLLRNAGKIVSRAAIMDYLWDDDSFVDDNTLTVNITRLREKLDSIGLPELIATRRGQGYILE